MTKQELKWQVDDQQDQINELQKRIATLENKTYWAWMTQPQPYAVTNAFPGSTTMSQHDQNT
jgi:hypothetical protein